MDEYGTNLQRLRQLLRLLRRSFCSLMSPCHIDKRLKIFTLQIPITIADQRLSLSHYYSRNHGCYHLRSFIVQADRNVHTWLSPFSDYQSSTLPKLTWVMLMFTSAQVNIATAQTTYGNLGQPKLTSARSLVLESTSSILYFAKHSNSHLKIK